MNEKKTPFISNGSDFYRHDPSADWSSIQQSKKAWMSVRDADLFETLLLRLCDLNSTDIFRVIEWGSGQSTLWYTNILDQLKIKYCWLSLEHNKEFFDEKLKNELEKKNSSIYYFDEIKDDINLLYQNYIGIISIVFDYGPISPFITGKQEECNVNMDDYIYFPKQHKLSANLVIVDGRKRRLCLYESLQIIEKNRGYVSLHDAWRPHYQCAWKAFSNQTRFGDDWWLGCNHEEDLKNLLPWHAFQRHSTFCFENNK